MNKTVDYLSKGLQVKERLITEIRKGALGEIGSPFPQVRRLAKEYGISLATAQKVVFMLKDSGFLVKKNKRYILAGNEPGSCKAHMVGVIVATLDNPFFAAMLKNIELVATKQKIEIVGVSSNYNIAREKQLLDMFERRKFDGIVACPCNPQTSAPNFRQLTLPHVFFGCKVDGIDADAALVQNFSAGQAVAQHLISTGKKKFGYIGLKNYFHDPRFQGFRSSLSEAGYSLDDNAIIHVSNTRVDESLRQIRSFLNRLSMPVGIFCFHDILAERLMHVATEMKIKIPVEIGIVGFDNLPIAAKLKPGLTSVAYPLDRMAELALHMLIQRIDGDKRKFSSSFVSPIIVPRGSTVEIKNSYEYMNMNKRCLVYSLS